MRGPPERPLRSRRATTYRSLQYSGIGIGVLFTGMVLYFTHRHEGRVLEPDIVRFTSYPEVETMPAFSPDGRQLAYVRATRDAAFTPTYWQRTSGQASIYVKLIGAATELRLTRHSGADSYPTWSRDGQYIAFYRRAPGASGCYIVSALGGHERQLTYDEMEVTGIAWFPDGRRLAIAHGAEGSHESPLMEVSLDTGEQRALTSPPGGILSDDSPAVSPDGKTLAFLRVKNQSAADTCFLALETKTVRCRALDGSWTHGLAWTALGDGIVVSAARSGGHRLWRYPVNGGTPVAVTSGEEYAGLPAVSRQGDQLAYVLSRLNVNLWQLDVDQASTPKPAVAQRTVSSSRLQSDPAFSPDGRKIAHMSDRSGFFEIWVTDAETQASMQLTHFRGPPAGSPSWSPDGRQIAFDANEGTHPDIFVVSADGGTSRRITAIPGENVVPTWSQDGKFIFFASNRSGDFQIWKVIAATGETRSHPAIQITQSGGFRAFESADGNYLYYAKGRGKPGLWRRSLLSGKEEPVLVSLQEWGWWALGPGVVYFFEVSHAANPQFRLKAFNTVDGRIREISTLHSLPMMATSVMTISRDGQHLAYAQIDSVDADIMLVENFR